MKQIVILRKSVLLFNFILASTCAYGGLWEQNQVICHNSTDSRLSDHFTPEAFRRINEIAALKKEPGTSGGTAGTNRFCTDPSNVMPGDWLIIKIPANTIPCDAEDRYKPHCKATPSWKLQFEPSAQFSNSGPGDEIWLTRNNNTFALIDKKEVKNNLHQDLYYFRKWFNNQDGTKFGTRVITYYATPSRPSRKEAINLNITEFKNIPLISPSNLSQAITKCGNKDLRGAWGQQSSYRWTQKTLQTCDVNKEEFFITSPPIVRVNNLNNSLQGICIGQDQKMDDLAKKLTLSALSDVPNSNAITFKSVSQQDFLSAWSQACKPLSVDIEISLDGVISYQKPAYTSMSDMAVSLGLENNTIYNIYAFSFYDPRGQLSDAQKINNAIRVGSFKYISSSNSSQPVPITPPPPPAVAPLPPPLPPPPKNKEKVMLRSIIPGEIGVSQATRRIPYSAGMGSFRGPEMYELKNGTTGLDITGAATPKSILRWQRVSQPLYPGTYLNGVAPVATLGYNGYQPRYYPFSTRLTVQISLNSISTELKKSNQFSQDELNVWESRTLNASTFKSGTSCKLRWQIAGVKPVTGEISLDPTITDDREFPEKRDFIEISTSISQILTNYPAFNARVEIGLLAECEFQGFSNAIQRGLVSYTTQQRNIFFEPNPVYLTAITRDNDTKSVVLFDDVKLNGSMEYQGKWGVNGTIPVFPKNTPSTESLCESLNNCQTSLYFWQPMLNQGAKKWALDKTKSFFTIPEDANFNYPIYLILQIDKSGELFELTKKNSSSNTSQYLFGPFWASPSIQNVSEHLTKLRPNGDKSLLIKRYQSWYKDKKSKGWDNQSISYYLLKCNIGSQNGSTSLIEMTRVDNSQTWFAYSVEGWPQGEGTKTSYGWIDHQLCEWLDQGEEVPKKEPPKTEPPKENLTSACYQNLIPNCNSNPIINKIAFGAYYYRDVSTSSLEPYNIYLSENGRYVIGAREESPSYAGGYFICGNKIYFEGLNKIGTIEASNKISIGTFIPQLEGVRTSVFLCSGNNCRSEGEVPKSAKLCRTPQTPPPPSTKPLPIFTPPESNKNQGPAPIQPPPPPTQPLPSPPLNDKNQTGPTPIQPPPPPTQVIRPQPSPFPSANPPSTGPEPIRVVPPPAAPRPPPQDVIVPSFEPPPRKVVPPSNQPSQEVKPTPEKKAVPIEKVLPPTPKKDSEFSVPVAR